MRERLGTDDTILICNIQLNSQEDGGDLTTSTAFIQKDLQPNSKLLNTQIKCNSKDCESLETRSESKTISINLEEDCNSLLYNSHNTMSTYDDDTVVSSLSKDEDYIVIPTMAATLRHSLRPIMETCHLSTEKAPPYEVSFEKKSTINGAETSRVFYSQQQEEESSQVSLSASSSCSQRMDELVANLAMTRSSTAPTLHCAKNTKIGTHLKSRPSIINRSQSLPVTKTEIAGNNPSSYSGNALLINGALMEGIRPRYNGDVFLHDENDLVYNPHAALVGDRKQRRSHRSLSVGGPEIFVGNLVGQSTLLASSSPLATDSSDASSVRRALFSVSESKKKLLIYNEEVSDGSACCQAQQPQSTMKKELKYMVSKVTTPLRAVKLIKDKKANLQRSAKGCLV